MGNAFEIEDPGLARASRIVVGEVLAVRAGKRVLIVSNPDADTAAISRALYNAAGEAGARPTLLFQAQKTQLDFAEEAVLAAIATEPEVVISITREKMGRDPQAIRKPYQKDGKTYDHIFRYLLRGQKSLRAFWSPNISREIFMTLVPIDYGELRQNCRNLKESLDRAVSIHIDAPGGTDLTIGIQDREAWSDDGDLTRPGRGGNLPAGEVFISPALGSSQGCIAFDGSLAVYDGILIPREPVRVEMKEGFVRQIQGGREAERLRESLRRARERAQALEGQGKLSPGQGASYARNAGNLGELGIGLNPQAKICGNVLADEKVYGTCHLALGSNYDEDAPALIHLDGLVKQPTITASFGDGTSRTLMKQGRLE